MKDKIKRVIFIISILYSITIIILMLYSYSTSINTIEFYDDSSNINTLNEYKEELKNIEESACKNAINGLISHYEKTSYNGSVNFQNIYINENGLLYYASPAFKDCNLNDDIRGSLAIKTIAASIQSDEVVQRLYFEYELRIPDLYNRSLMETNLDVIRYNIDRKNQLEVIKILIDVLKGESEYE